MTEITLMVFFSYKDRNTRMYKAKNVLSYIVELSLVVQFFWSASKMSDQVLPHEKF